MTLGPGTRLDVQESGASWENPADVHIARISIILDYPSFPPFSSRRGGEILKLVRKGRGADSASNT